MKRKFNYVTAAAVLAAAAMMSPMTALADEEFDPVYYAQTYPDVVDALGLDADVLYAHYINNGQYEGRFPNANAAAGITTSSNTDEQVVPVTAEAFTPSENTLEVLKHTEGVVVDFMQPGDADLRTLLQNVPIDTQLKETVVRIGGGVQWNDDSKYQQFNAGYDTACDAYVTMLTDIVYGRPVSGNGLPFKSISRNKITPDTIQQYDTLVLAGGGYSGLHAVLVLYIDPETGDMLTTEGNFGGLTRTGWNLRGNVYEISDKLIKIRRPITQSQSDNDIW